MKLTPPKLAQRWGCSAERVIALIRAGELRAIDVVVRRGGRPRYLIDERDVQIFEDRRVVKCNASSTQRRRVLKEIPTLV